MSAAKVLLAAACVLATVISGVNADAKVKFVGAAVAMTPSTINIVIGTDAEFKLLGAGDGLEANDRLEIHLPGFGGAYNSFGGLHAEAKPAGDFLPEKNGITALDADGKALTGSPFSSAEWDAARNVLKLTVLLATVRGVAIDGKFLRLGFDSKGLPSGLGPLPPNGGIDKNWYKMAWVRWWDGKVSDSLCTGGPVPTTNVVGLGADTCKLADFLTIPGDKTLFAEFQFSKDQTPLVTGKPRMSVQRIGAAGTASAPTFSLLTAKGSATGAGSTNCMTVTMATNVNLVTSDQNTITTITLHGLTGSSTASTDTLPIFVGAQCDDAPEKDAEKGIRVSASADVSVANDVATRLPLTDLLVSSASTKKTWQAVWDKDDGTAIFQIGEGRSISAGQVVVFSIALVNGADFQDSRAVSASATGYYCKTNLCLSANTQTVSILATAFQSSSKMLKILAPTFETAVIAQDTSDPSESATITVTLKANQALATSTSFITISGICGTLTNEDVELVKANDKTTVGTTGTFQKAASWDVATKVLKITVGGTGLKPDVTYAFTLKWKLVANENAACPVTVSASGTNDFVSAVMDNSAGSAGKVDTPQFKTFKIGQYSTRPGVDNYVCVTLKTNYDFKSEDIKAGDNGKSTFTLRGLLGSQKNDELSTTLYACPTKASPTPSALTGKKVPFMPILGTRTANTYDFIKATGSAVYVMDSTGFVSGTEYSFAMRITNNAGANPCQSVTLQADGEITQTATMGLASTSGKALQDGEVDGDVCALKTYAPGFHTKIIAQECKLAEQDNVITATLRSNVDFKSTSTALYSDIIITGLTGSDSPSTTTITDLTSTTFIPAGDGKPFVPSFTSVEWVKSTGTLTLRLAAHADCKTPTAPGKVNVCIKAGSTYEIAIKLLNGKVPQSAPNVRVSVLYGTTTRKTTESQVMTAPDAKFAALALLSKDTILDKYNIGQVVAQQDKVNALCVTLRTNKDLSTETAAAGKRFVAFTIKGLTGFQTDSQELSLRIAKKDGTVTAGNTAVSKDTTDIGNMFCSTETCDSGDENMLVFDADEGHASFFLNDAVTMVKDKDYSFCFQVTNPDKSMSCKAAVIAAKDASTATEDAIEFRMTQDTGTLEDHPSGSKCAGFTDTRHFSRATFRVDSNVTAFESTAIVELITNYEITTQQVITISGLSGFKAKGQGSTLESLEVDLLTFTANGEHAIDIGEKGSWDGTSVLTFTTGSAATSILSTYAHLDTATKTDDFVYVMSFKIVNPASQQAAPVISITVSDAFTRQSVESGIAGTTRRRAGLVPMSSRRAAGDTVFTFKANAALYGGESIVLELPHYKGEDGAVFSVMSSPNTAFTTYESANELGDNGIMEDKARAMYTTGFVATGSDHSGTAAVDGTLILDSDDEAYDENKENWFSEGAIWSGSAEREMATSINALSADYGTTTIAYMINSTTIDGDIHDRHTKESQFSPFGGQNGKPNQPDAWDDALAGTIMTCTAESKTQSRYILEGNSKWTAVFVENAFTIATTACTISYKHSVGKYTGHTIMMENGEEYVMKQGGGPFYSLSDGSGVKIPSMHLDNKKYTVYSQLILTAAKGSTIAKGEEVEITIPEGIIVAPADMSALVNEEDDNSATIAEKTTIKQMLVTTIHYSRDRVNAAKGSEGSATLTLSKTWPYAYDYENEASLSGSFVELFGAVSLLAVGEISKAGGKQHKLTTSMSLLSANDLLSHDMTDHSWNKGGWASSAIAAGIKKEPQAGGSGAKAAADQFWTSLVDVSKPTDTECIIDLGNQSSLKTSVVTEPENIMGYNGSWSTAYANDRATPENTIWLLDAFGQFLSEPPVRNITESGMGSYQTIGTDKAGSDWFGSDSINSTIGLGVYVPNPVVTYTAGNSSSWSYGSITVTDNADYDDVSSGRAKHLSSSIRAAFTIVPALTFELSMSSGADCAGDGSDVHVITVSAGVSTCGSDLGIGGGGSIGDRYPCGVSILIEGAGADGPSITLPTDMAADACFSVSVLTPDEITWGAEGRRAIYSAGMDIADLKAFKWGRTWMVVPNILSLTVSGLTSPVNVSSSTITAADGAPTRRRLLTVCPTGFEYRIGSPGGSFEDTCKCPSACGWGKAQCETLVSGEFTAILVPADACVDDNEWDYTGAIVGGVIGGLLGLLLIAAIAYYCCRQEESGPVGRPPAPEKAMVPVYLPQSYPVIAAEYTAAAPMPEFQQPMYSGSVQPMMQAQSPYMVEQPQYVVEQQQPWMVQQQPVAYGM